MVFSWKAKAHTHCRTVTVAAYSSKAMREKDLLVLLDGFKPLTNVLSSAVDYLGNFNNSFAEKEF